MQFSIIEFDFSARPGTTEVRIHSLISIHNKLSKIELNLTDAKDELHWILETEIESNGEFRRARELRKKIKFLETAKEELINASK